MSRQPFPARLNFVDSQGRLTPTAQVYLASGLGPTISTAEDAMLLLKSGAAVAEEALNLTPTPPVETEPPSFFHRPRTRGYMNASKRSKRSWRCSRARSRRWRT